MRSTPFAVAVAFALVALAVPAAVPALEAVSPVGGAAAAPPCVFGQDSNCLIPIYCVREPCPHFP